MYFIIGPNNKKLVNLEKCMDIELKSKCISFYDTVNSVTRFEYKSNKEAVSEFKKLINLLQKIQKKR